MTEPPIVLGCGVAGIAAASALRASHGQVVVIEKDFLPEDADPRQGVPQAGQLHNLLARAQIHLERLLPGFREALLEAGAGNARVSADTHVWELGRRMPERDLGLRLMCAPRPVIETVARRLLLEGGGVTIRQGVRAAGLELDDSGAILGITVEEGGRLASVAASIVVDATGSQSAAPRWLRAAGRAEPVIESVRVSQWYVSSIFERPSARASRDEFWLVFPTPPKTRGGLVSPAGRERWYVSLSGRAGDEAPRTHAEMRSYAATLETPWISELLEDARGIAEPNLFRRESARWRRYDLIDDPVTGFLPLGDSMAALNPLLGQGMSVAAWQADSLGELLGAGLNGAELTRAYLGRAAEACKAAWTVGGLVDPKAPVEGARLDSSDFDALSSLLECDPELHRVYVGVWHLVEPASALTCPELTARLEAARLSSRTARDTI